MIVSDRRWAMLCGVVLGGMVAAGILFHMFRHLDIALDLEPKQASRHIRAAAIRRMAAMALCAGASVYLYRYVHPVGMILGLFGVKVSAFLYPSVHKILDKDD
ncbi:MAG: hypothetical protein K2J67_12665 [Lachnospiraceae bacterium]|nr:hypothetical protein [Lachnospiraceae bacterium]